ncbi:Mitochondrial rRNA Methyltransferase [Scheffersomyces stipitis CBS 6054]|uniref:rRNA methyltransferase 2, mitochondrial n=1 Tax=Scheffersomyces stipitis (strain ATCC 58785 / CBS 6054 / NBRC 10063 / NRRL Y-11545) TaxID=322104 RepID=A3LN04_PICST|nr:Mitochondrial rRNA Methyltransferase [Scheffersomyces stipitis CBS 6054]ABN64775.2 Mitochondrial rRNA Methyltransferase [Scheffersomyces stipitis CBS 6054]
MYIAVSRCLRSETQGDIVNFIRYKSKSSTRWLNRQVNDPHTKQSKSDHYRSRAAYKLIEIDQKYSVFNRKTENILDLGFAPGAWTQVAVERMKKLGVKSSILGVDLILSTAPKGSHFIQGNILSKKTHDDIRDFFTRKQSEIVKESEGSEIEIIDQKRKMLTVDLVLSDMMSNTSGIKDNDHYASMDLCDGAIILACEVLKEGGSLVMKFYTGKEDQVLQERMRLLFEKVYRFKPQACRNESREMYIIGVGKKRDICVEEVFH